MSSLVWEFSTDFMAILNTKNNFRIRAFPRKVQGIKKRQPPYVQHEQPNLEVQFQPYNYLFTPTMTGRKFKKEKGVAKRG